MTRVMQLIRGAAAWLTVAVVLSLCACKPASESVAQIHGKVSSETVSVMTDSVNYMHERSVAYALYDLALRPPRAIGGAIVDRLTTGGEKGCCVGLPTTWRPGLTLRLVWHESDRIRSYEENTRDMEVPRYETPADLYVVFYPGNEVELVVSAGEPGHPGWRGRLKKTPWEQCVETYTRKPCFMALPKQFDTRSSKGACTYMKENNVKDGDELCQSANIECVRDYEDKRFCTQLLWDAYRK